MYGKNPIAKIDQREDGSLMVNSLWYTIQGEGPDAGKPAIFLRLKGCNLSCFWCDTEFETGDLWSLEAVVETIEGMNCKFVVITGGEPLLQNVVPLMLVLNYRGISVSIETAGTVWVPGLDLLINSPPGGCKNLIVCSPKTPKINPQIEKVVGAYKYIINVLNSSKSDGLPMMSTQKPGVEQNIFRPTEGVPVYVQPMDEDDEKVNRINQAFAAKICMEYGYRLSLQMHKIVGVS